MRDDEAIERLLLSLNPDDNARARWLLFLRAEQQRILRPYLEAKPKKKRKRKAA